MSKALNWRQIASLTNEQLDNLLDSDDYDDVTLELASREYEARADYESEAGEHQAAYDDYYAH